MRPPLVSRPIAPALPRVCVVQDGARLHYAVPIALQRAGGLERVFTDWYAAAPVEKIAATLLARVIPDQARRMSERVAPELDRRRVKSRPSLALHQIGRKRYAGELDLFAMLSERLGRWITRRGFGDSNGLFGFVRNIAPAVCEAARAAGLKVVVDQMIAPFDIERREHAIQAQHFPGWSTEPAMDKNQTLGETERRTWERADRITCASDYVRDGLLSSGVEAGKIAVLPYPFDCGSLRPIDRRPRARPVTVGFVGKVGVRKGVPYIFELAKRFDPASVRFVLVGPVWIDPAVVEKHRGNVELVGGVTRSQIGKWLERFDLFLLPSTCEGSAGAVSEAMAAGLPVVVSPNAGSVVRHGVEGYIAAYDDIDAMARHIGELAGDPQRRHDMGLAGRARVEGFGIDPYGLQLMELFSELLIEPRTK